MKFEDKVAVVTGSAGGIGRAISEHLASMGAHVVITSRRTDRAEHAAQEIADRGGSAHGVRFELENPETGDELIQNIVERCGRLDILVNNAVSHKTLPPCPLEQMDCSKIHSGVTANLTNVLALTAKAHEHLKKTKGSVLNIGSAVVNRGMLGIPLYTVVKGALTQATKIIAAEWAKDGIRVNQINPGVVRSEAYKNMGVPEEAFSQLLEYYKGFHPLGRVGSPEDVAFLAANLLSNEASWATGAIIDLDGGYSLQGVSLPG